MRYTGLALHSLSNTFSPLAIVPNLDVLEGYLGYEVLAFPCFRDAGVKLIDLLESEAFRLVNEEIHESNADEAKGSPDEENLALKIRFVFVDHVWGGVGNGKVEQPLAMSASNN